jgi:16S rRNA (cytosine1402-N4)-methyltransferase
MSQVFEHEPVMVDEVVELFAGVPAGLVIDATVGAGGHAAAILAARPDVELLGLDRDADAVSAAAARLAPFGSRVVLRQARFDRIADEAMALGKPVCGVLFDLGVSSPQLDRPERGFSYRVDAPLDMRMDPTGGPTAADVVNATPRHELARLFAEHGEGRFAGRIARAVEAARPIATTTALAEVVRAALPAAVRRHGGHPARRVFQAVRVAVNEELEVLTQALPDAIELLVPGGRCVAIAYHSGEDRIVKAAFVAAETGGCTCPPRLPCTCGAVRLGRPVFRRARRPGDAESTRNRRADSARLRAFEKGPA